MSSYVTKYEFMGHDSAGLRGGEVQFQVSKTVPRLGTSRRILPLQITDYSLLQVLTVLPFKQHALETAMWPFPLVRLGLK